MSDINPRFFYYNKQFFGGTEYMAKLFHEHVAPYVSKMKSKYNCLILPGTSDIEYYQYINEPKNMIIWLHNTIEQFNPGLQFILTNRKFVEKIEYIITVSEYLKQNTIQATGIDPERVIVIPNAISPIQNDLSRFKDVKVPQITYTSSPERGLGIGLSALTSLDIDFRLNVFNNVVPDLMDMNDSTKKLLNDPRFYFYGKTPHRTVLDHMSRSHIFMHSCSYPETFCISLVEGFSANCLSVYSNIGSLEEIGSGLGMMYDIKRKSDEEHVEIFREKISIALSMIKDGTFDPKDQAKIVNEKYSIESFKNKWIEFYEKRI